MRISIWRDRGLVVRSVPFTTPLLEGWQTGCGFPTVYAAPIPPPDLCLMVHCFLLCLYLPLPQHRPQRDGAWPFFLLLTVLPRILLSCGMTKTLPRQQWQAAGDAYQQRSWTRADNRSVRAFSRLPATTCA